MNYYELLDIARDADSNTVKRAYFAAVKLHSPDSDPEGFKAIRIAYETLSDKKKRAEYDSYFIVSENGITTDLQSKLLAAHELIRENKYKQAVDFLTELSDENQDSNDVKRLLAEVFLIMGKIKDAEKTCEDLLEKNTADYETLILHAKIAEAKGQTTKPEFYYNKAVNAAPLNPKLWIAYIRYALRNKKERVPVIFQRAMEQDINMFRDDYSLYLVTGKDLDLFNQDNQSKYYDKFAELFINDKNPDEETYEQVMLLMPTIVQTMELIPFLQKILPTLENSKYRKDEDSEDFEFIHIIIILYSLRTDKRIHQILIDLSHFLFMEDEDNNERTRMESFIVFNLPLLRPSIKVLKNEYPECFKLNEAFYLDVLNEKKSEYLNDIYTGKLKKIKPIMRGYMDGEEDDDDYNDITPFVRESPKVGRNDPCPCGSGKKYKKCCGR